MEEFRVPEDVMDPVALQVQTAGRFCASPDLPRLKNDTRERLNDICDVLGSRLADGDADALSQQDNFDDAFSLVRDFKYLPSEIKGRVLEILHESVKRTVSALGEESGARNTRGGRGRRSDHGEQEEGAQRAQGQAELPLRNAFKMSVYLLFSAAFPSEECYSSAKQVTGLDRCWCSFGKLAILNERPQRGRCAWENARQAVLESMRLALTADCSRLWRQGIPDRSFMGLFLRLSCKMLELPETAKHARQGELALRLVAEPFRLAPAMETEISSAVFTLVRENRHLADFAARLCYDLVERHGDSRLGAELVREVGRMDMPDVNSKNTAAAAPVINVSEFLRELVTVLPGTVHAHASVLLPHLSSRPHQIRHAVVASLAEVVAAGHEDKMAAVAAGGEGAQVKADPRRVRMKDRNRDALLDQLVERALDVSPFVRLAVLRAWSSIAERGALPRKRFLIAARLGRNRLRDQSSLVRKEAVKLLSTLLEYNPYNSTLDLKVNQESLRDAREQGRRVFPRRQDESRGRHAASSSEVSARRASSARLMDRGDFGVGSRRDQKNATSQRGRNFLLSRRIGFHTSPFDALVSNPTLYLPPLPSSNVQLTKEQAEVVVKAAQCHHLRAAVLFIEEFQEAGVSLEGLLGSTTVSDVVEALRYFVTACRFQLPGALDAIKKSLTLIWRTEAPIETAIKSAFVQVTQRRGQHPNAAQFVAKNLVTLVNESKAGELASLEEVVASLVKDTLDKDKPTVFEQLWCAVGRKDQLPRARAGALHAIAMGSSANPSLVNDLSRLDVLRETALGRATMESRDWRTVRCACDPKIVMGSKEVDHILPRLVYFLQGKWCARVSAKASDEERAVADGEMRDCAVFASAAMAVLFHLNRAPEALGAGVVRRIAADTLSTDTVSPHALSRLCFVLGHLALKLLVYAEDLAGGLERARAKVKPPAKEKKAGDASDDNDDDATAQELGLNAEASAEDEQRLAELVEKEIVGRNLLGAFGPLLVRLVADERGRFGHPLLRESSVLALSKFMCISEAFCDRNLSLLFTTLERSKDTSVQANIIVALGDLAFRFPNALEPWNPRIYDRLTDESPVVRANAIMVLTHLILNDMVKVKGQVSGLAVCMVDDEPRIQDAAKVFFHKYSERGTNPIYNVLPDIVGRLSVDEMLAPKEYQEIMNFLMQYVKKDKLTELLAEKLCARLAASTSDRQARGVSYCLGQLKVTEKAVGRLAELVPTYKEKLQDEEVFNNFKVVVSRTKSFATVEMKEAVAEWEAQLRKHHEGGAEDEDAAARAARAAGRKRSRAGNKRASSSSTTNVRRGKKEAEAAATPDAGGSAGVGERSEPNAGAARERASSRHKGKKKQAAVLSSDSESGEAEEDGDSEVDDNGDNSSDGFVSEDDEEVFEEPSTVVKEQQEEEEEEEEETDEEEEEEAEWGSEEEFFEEKTPKAEAAAIDKKPAKGRARETKENRVMGKAPGSADGSAGPRGSRRSRNASPLSPKN
ncbi:unnamed protein product [Scytosiphon promiscuus]